VWAGQPVEAAADLRRSLQFWSGLKDVDVDARVDRASALALLAGLGGDPKSGVTAAEGNTFADQAVAALRDAVQAGWRAAGTLKEPDFDALRKRDDFRKLQAELEKNGAAAGKGR
jgi:hypothetical protein